MVWGFGLEYNRGSVAVFVRTCGWGERGVVGIAGLWRYWERVQDMGSVIEVCSESRWYSGELLTAIEAFLVGVSFLSRRSSPLPGLL